MHCVISDIRPDPAAVLCVRSAATVFRRAIQMYLLRWEIAETKPFWFVAKNKGGGETVAKQRAGCVDAIVEAVKK